MRRSASAVAAALVATTLAGLPPRRAAAQAPAVGVTSGEMPAWLRARLDTRLDARTRLAVEHVIDSALTTGVPAEPLVDKALEGASKGAPSEAIVRAVRGLAVDLATARQSLGPQSLGEELTAGAAAIRAGVDADALHRLRAVGPGQPLVVALSVLTDLIASGVPADNATRSVLALTSTGAADEQLVAFRRNVERDIGVGAPPGVAVTLRLPGVSASRAPLDPVRRQTPPKPQP